MKKILTALLLLITGSSYSMAQDARWRGIALGADRDTLLYIIASPFDNWYINASAGVQTYIGNTPDKVAAWNKPDFSLRAEIGKWIIPDLAVSLRLGFGTAHSKSLHGSNNPLIDFDNPITYASAEYGPYYPISAYLASAMAIITFDWTNFLLGYEAGKRKHWHFYTPVGLGGTVMLGKIVNTNYVNKPDVDKEIGDLSRNFELAFTGGFMTEYFVSKKVSFNAALELFFARGSLDDYNYNLDANTRRIDLVPSLHIGAKFNLLKTITKRDLYTQKGVKSIVNHEFLAFGSRNTIPTLKGQVERLYRERDSIQNLAGQREAGDLLRIDSINNEIIRLNDEMAKLRESMGERPPINIFDELLAVNEILNLPSTIVYFQLDKYDLDYNARKRLETFSKEASHLDDTTEFYIIGAADSLTGSIRHNQKLSERRCEVAYDLLVNTYGMNKNQLIRIYAGGINVYDPKENNRITLVIQRTPVTEEIVDRWVRRSKERQN